MFDIHDLRLYNMLTITYFRRLHISNVKMSDIANAAGVSLATVGRVLHNNGYVSKENREKIETLIHEMGYVPNQMARGLKNSQSMLIGHMVVFNPNMLFAKISLAVNQAAAAQGFHVLTMTSYRGLNEEENQLNELIGRRVDGVIITSNGSIPSGLVERLVERNIPVVMVERTYDLPYVDRIQVDDLGGAKQAVEHILQKGHRNIGFVGMQLVHEVEKLRYQGYQAALKEAGIRLDPDAVCLMSDYSAADGDEAARHLMNLKVPPTAIFATSDLFACGILQYLYTIHKRVPEDVSIVGYDDTLSTMLTPQITSIGLDLDEIGADATALLIERMEDVKRPAQTLPIQTVLIDRHSVAAPQKV